MWQLVNSFVGLPNTVHRVWIRSPVVVIVWGFSSDGRQMLNCTQISFNHHSDPPFPLYRGDDLILTTVHPLKNDNTSHSFSGSSLTFISRIQNKVHFYIIIQCCITMFSSFLYNIVLYSYVLFILYDNIVLYNYVLFIFI